MAMKQPQSGLGIESTTDLRVDGVVTVAFAVLTALTPLVLIADLLPRAALLGFLGIAALASGLVAAAGGYAGYRWLLARWVGPKQA
jgi:hypothetical protein